MRHFYCCYQKYYQLFSPNRLWADGVLTSLKKRGYGSFADPLQLPQIVFYCNLCRLVTPTLKSSQKIDQYLELLHFS